MILKRLALKLVIYFLKVAIIDGKGIKTVIQDVLSISNFFVSL